MNTKRLVTFLAGTLCALLLGRIGQAQKPSAPSKPKLAVSIKPQHVADALRAVIESDREVYTAVLASLPADSDAGANLAGAARPRLLPGPCEMLRRGSEAVASKGVEYSYVLRSQQPVNRRNVPETEVERKGLQFVSTQPGTTYSSEELLGGRWYFTAVYPDVAKHPSCVSCHNQLQTSPDKSLKLGDVFGALVVRIALEL